MKPKFGLDEKGIQQIAGHLQKSVAHTYALYIATLNCHWNIEDPRFHFLHEMFQSQYENLAENGDLLAERIRQMGVKVTASLSQFSKDSSFKIDAHAQTDEMLELLAKGHEEAIIHLRELSELGEQYKDFGLVDLLGGILRDHEKTAWFLRSHL